MKDCGCVAYYMPRNPDIMPICAPEKLHCVEHALTTVEETAFSDHGSKDSGGHGEGHGGGGHGSSSVGNCKCLPSCTEVKFPHETSTSSVKRAKFVHIPDKLRGEVEWYSFSFHI